MSAPTKPDAAKPANAEKKKGFNIVLLLVPVAIIAALVLAFTLPPTHAMLVNGPLKPLLGRFGVKSGPATLAANAKPSADPAAEAQRLRDEVAAAKRDAAAKDSRIAQLQSQVDGLQSPTPSPTPSAASVSQDVKRAADYWAGMDADKAAEIIKVLPDAYVKRVLGQMPPDAVADIMSALPPKTAARLTVGDADGEAKPTPAPR